jgi:hypothetical protein
MTTEILNENQRRRIATHLHLLEEDLAALGRLPALARTGEAYDQIRELLTQISGRADALRAALDLGAYRTPPLRRRVGALAEIWAVRVEDLVAVRLKSYGTVHPELGARLDARVTELKTLLERLADAAADLPEA